MGYRVIAISRGSSKAAAAHSLGAHEYIDSSTCDPGMTLKELGGAHVAFTTALDPEAFKPLIRGLRILGKLVVLSLPGEMQLSHADMVQRGVSVQAWPVGTNRDSEDAVAFAVRCGVECWDETWGLEEVQEAYSEYLKTWVGNWSRANFW